MRSSNLRIHVRADNLAEIHAAIEDHEKKGWRKATMLHYTHDETGSGWEIGMERPIVDLPDGLDDEDPAPGSIHLDWFTAVFMAVAVAVGCVSVWAALVLALRWM